MGKVTRLNPGHNNPRIDVRPVGAPDNYDPTTARLIRRILEKVAQNLDRHSAVSSIQYHHAYKNAARIVRNHKPD